MTVPRAILTLTFALLMFCSSGISSQAAQAGFSWLPNNEPTVTGYKIHYGTASLNYTFVIDVGLPEVIDGRVQTKIDGLEEGQTYYFAATAYSDTTESDYSTEVEYVTGSTADSPAPLTGPTAVITSSSAVGSVPFTVNFNGIGSTSPQPPIAHYSWDFGDGTVAEGIAVAHTYTVSGTYYPSLTVLDSANLTDNISTPVVTTPSQVQTPNQLPHSLFVASHVSGASPLIVAFNGAESSDNDGTIESYLWDFGDGTMTTGISAEHTFTEIANYTVTLQVTDNMGGTAFSSRIVSVQPGDNQSELGFTSPSGLGPVEVGQELTGNGESIVAIDDGYMPRSEPEQDCNGSDCQSSLTQTQLSQLYVSIFGRASEGDGNLYWRSEQDDMVIATNTMLATMAAQVYFGSTLNNNRMFIEFIYENTLGKTYAEDPAGVDYWVNELASGKSKGEVVAVLINAAMDPQYSGLPAQDQFINKVTVSNYTADTITTIPDVNDLSAFVNFISDVTDDAATVVTAKAAVDAF